MLALSRKKGESIMIGDDIEIVVLGTSGDQIKIGIVAPKSVPIFRKEIFEQIQKENIEASKPAVLSLADIMKGNLSD